MNKLRNFKNIELLKKQLSDNDQFGYDDLDFILDPRMNVILYRYLREIGIATLNKYVIKVQDAYFPRIFDSREDAKHILQLPEDSDEFSSREYAFAHISGFKNAIIEEIK